MNGEYNKGALLNAPPRLSDLRGVELTRALHGRHLANRHAWWLAHLDAGLTIGERIRRRIARLTGRG